MLELNQRTIGRYTVLEKVSSGGMSSIFRAHDPQQDQTVALKVLPPSMAMDPGFKARFEREVDVLREFNHPNIVPILDFGEVDGVCYIAMPIYPGTLATRMKEGMVPLEEVGRMMEQACAALTYAHERGVVHRDVKPSNLLIDDQGKLLLSDFGFAHLMDESLHLTGSALIGTPAYMSPEQCAGEMVDGRTDQYSLAVVLYQLVTGKLPFDSDSAMSTVVKHLNEPVPLPTDVNPRVPLAVQEVLLKALAKDPTKRYEDMEHFQRALQSAIDQAGHPSLRSRVIWPLNRLMKRVLRMVGVGAEAPAKLSRAQRLLRYLALFVALAGVIVIAAWYSFGLGSGDGNATPQAIVQVATPTDLWMTIEAVSTSMASRGGTPIPPGQMGTAVAATLTALAPTNTPTPSATPTSTARTPVSTRLPTGVPIPPTSTPTSPTSTPIPPTATPTPAPLLPMHVSDLSCNPGKATIGVHDSQHARLVGVLVTGQWTGSGDPVSGSCTTGSNGGCSIPRAGTTFTVTGLYQSGRFYDPSANDVGPSCQ